MRQEWIHKGSTLENYLVVGLRNYSVGYQEWNEDNASFLQCGSCCWTLAVWSDCLDFLPWANWCQKCCKLCCRLGSKICWAWGSSAAPTGVGCRALWKGIAQNTHQHRHTTTMDLQLQLQLQLHELDQKGNSRSSLYPRLSGQKWFRWFHWFRFFQRILLVDGSRSDLCICFQIWHPLNPPLHIVKKMDIISTGYWAAHHRKIKRNEPKMKTIWPSIETQSMQQEWVLFSPSWFIITEIESMHLRGPRSNLFKLWSLPELITTVLSELFGTTNLKHLFSAGRDKSNYISDSVTQWPSHPSSLQHTFNIKISAKGMKTTTIT